MIPLTPPPTDIMLDNCMRYGNFSDNTGMSGQGPNHMAVCDDTTNATPAPVTVDTSHGQGTSYESNHVSGMGLDTDSHTVTLDR